MVFRGIVFLLATTDPYKILLIIILRTQRFDFRGITQESFLNNRERCIKHLVNQVLKNCKDNQLNIQNVTEQGCREWYIKEV